MGELELQRESKADDPTLHPPATPPRDTQPSLHIIGIGSPVAGDDLGWKAIAALQSIPFDAEVRWLTLDRPGPSLLNDLDPKKAVILIDAMDADLPPGSLRVLRLEDLVLDALPPSSHHFGLAESLALGQALGCLPEQLHIIGIQKAEGSVPETEWIGELQRLVSALIAGLGKSPMIRPCS